MNHLVLDVCHLSTLMVGVLATFCTLITVFYSCLSLNNNDLNLLRVLYLVGDDYELRSDFEAKLDNLEL